MSPDGYLEEAIRLSREHMRANAGGPFGAIIVHDQQIIGRGWNQVTSTNDPTAHAEIVAIREACCQQHAFSLAGCEIYTSCEPCPMCLAAIYWARISRIYYAATKEDAAAAGFDDQAFYQQLLLPQVDRAIPMLQSMREPAVAVLVEWSQKTDRVPY